MHTIMSRKVASSAPFNSLTRYHSAPGSFMGNMNGGEGDLPQLQGSSNPHTRADAILTSLFSDDLTAWTQQNGAGGPVHMFHQFPILDEHNNFMAEQLDPNKPTSEMEKLRPGKLSNGLASGSKEAGLYQFAALGYTNIICADEFVSDQVPRNKWKLHEDESNESIVLAQPQVPTSSKGLIRTSSLQQSSSPAQLLKYFSSGTQTPEGCEEQRKSPTSGRTSHLPKPVARNLIEDLSETLNSPIIELNGCGEVDNEKCSTLDNFSSVTGTSPPTSKKRFRNLTTDSSSSDILLDGEPQEQTCISLPKQELLPSNLTPCQSRAKRGHATHPRSIAERVRRTRISERIKKLQDLVPNMDKQINTADMLDEVVDYVKYLQNQVEELSKDRPPKVD